MINSRSRKWLGPLVMGIALALVTATPQAARAGEEACPTQGGTLVFGGGRNFPTMHPHVKTYADTQRLRQLIYDTLVIMNEKTGEVLPALATSWEVSDDARVYTFKLREGVKFHNGKTLTAEDVKYSLDYILNPANNAYGYDRVNDIQQVDVVGPLTVRLTLKSTNTGFLPSLALDKVQGHSIQPAGSLPEGGEGISDAPPGTGPFKFVRWKPGEEVLLERFAEHWGKVPCVERVRVVPLPKSEVRMTALRAGDVDMARVSVIWAEQIHQGKVKGINLTTASLQDLRLIGLNLHDPVLKDVRVRRAIEYAIDRQEIVDGFYRGFASPTNQIYPPGHKWYVKEFPVRPKADLEKARQIVKETGAGDKTLDLMMTTGDEPIAAIVQAQLKRAGFDVKFLVLDAAASAENQVTGNYDLDWTGGSFSATPSDTYSQLGHCERDLNKRVSDWTGYCDEDVTRWLEQMKQPISDKERYELLKKVIGKTYWTETGDVPRIALTWGERFFGTREDKVGGFEISPFGNWRYHNGGLAYTYLKKKE